MVKINYSERISVLQSIVDNGKRINKSLPKVEIRLNKLQKQKRKGNKSLFDFK